MTTSRPSTFSRIAMTVVIVLLVGLSWIPILDNTANKHIDEGMTRSLASFATARALNGVISMAQGTETAFQPAGVGVVLTPGQILDPINDLVENFSDLMLIASIAYGVEKILIEIGATQAFAALITLLGVSWAILHVLGKAVPSVLSRFLVMLLVIRFAVPVMTVGSNWLFEQFMEARYQKSQQFLDKSAEQEPVVNAQKPAAPAPPKALEKPSWYGGLMPDGFTLPNFQIPESPVEKIKQKLAASVRHIVDIMVIFVLQVVVLPIVILWIIYSSARRMIEP